MTPGTELREAAEALREFEREGFAFLPGAVSRVPWEDVARWLDERADDLTDKPLAASREARAWNEGRESGAYWSSARGRPVDPRITPPPSGNPYLGTPPGQAADE